MKNELTQRRSDLYYIFLIVIQGLIFGIGNPLIKFAYESISPLWALAIRFTLASLIFLVMFGKTALPELRQTKIRVWLPTSLCMALAYITCNVALHITTATSVGFLMSLAIVFTAPLARVVLGRRIHRSFIPVLILAVAGLYLLSMNNGKFQFGFGEFLALLCSFGMAGSLVWGEDCLNTLSASAVSLIQMAVTAVACILCTVIMEPFPNLAAVEPKAWWIIVYLVIFCSCVCYALQNIALTYLPSAIVSLTQCLEPIFTALFAFLILDERLSIVGFCGAALLIFCIIYGNYTETKNNTKEIPS